MLVLIALFTIYYDVFYSSLHYLLNLHGRNELFEYNDEILPE